jgi:DNA-binding NarL/FixJ family response regulator
MSGARPKGSALPQVLLIEPDGLVRGTVASVCRDLQLAQVHQALSAAEGEQWLKAHRPTAVLLSLTEGTPALDLLARLRAGGFACPPQLPVVAMARSSNASLVLRLKELEVRRLLLQPFRLRDVIHTLEQVCQPATATPAPATMA